MQKNKGLKQEYHLGKMRHCSNSGIVFASTNGSDDAGDPSGGVVTD